MTDSRAAGDHRKLTDKTGRLWFAVLLLIVSGGIQAEPAVIRFQSTVTSPIWSPTLPDGGMGGAILHLLSTAANVRYEIEYLPVKRFQQSSATYLVGDPYILTNQKPYAVLPILLFRSAFFFYQPHHPAIAVHSLSDLKGHTLGVLRGTVEDKYYFTSQGIKVEENDSIESLLKKLKKGRVDLCILVKISGIHTIKQLFPQEQKNFAFVEIPKSERPIALIIDQNTPDGKIIAARYRKVLHKTLYSRKYHEILETYYGKDYVPDDWSKQMNKFELLYATETN